MGKYDSKQIGEVKTVKRTISFIVSGALLFLALAFLVTNAILGGGKLDSASKLGCFAGYIGAFLLITGIGTFLIFRFKSVNKRANGMMILSIVMILSSLGSFTLSMKNIGPEGKPANTTKEAYKRTLSSSIGGGIISDQFSEAAYGENAKYLTTLSQSLNQIVEMRKNYMQKISEINEQGVNAETFNNSEKLDAALNRYKDLKTYIVTYQTGYEDLIKKMRQNVSDMKVDEIVKQAFLKGFDGSFGKNSDMMKQYFDIEKNFADANVELLQFIKNAKGKFQYSEDNGFQFNNQNDSGAFKNISGKIDSLINQESKWMEDNNKRLLEYQKSIESIN